VDDAVELFDVEAGHGGRLGAAGGAADHHPAGGDHEQIVRNKGGFEEVVDSMLNPTDDAGCEAFLICARARGEIMRLAVILAAAFGLCSIAAGPALADGGGGGSDRSNTTTCSKGEVWDSRSQKCVKAENGVLPDKALTDYAFALVRAGRYGEALDVLDLLKNPNTPVALNYRGYATRKLGRVDEGISYYLKSVALDPHYAQVREYLGEAYLLKGDMARATAQLQAIKQICGSTCEEYEHLAVAIADPADL
jgi:tetratricopeptide (TPR) repeat protein